MITKSDSIQTDLFSHSKGSEGTFPACICGEGKVYVPEKDECVFVDRSQCPAGSRKVNNKCVCDNVNEFKYELDEIFWICRPWYIPTTNAPPTPCQTHQHRVGDKCEWDRCPVEYTSKTGEFKATAYTNYRKYLMNDLLIESYNF